MAASVSGHWVLCCIYLLGVLTRGCTGTLTRDEGRHRVVLGQPLRYQCSANVQDLDIMEALHITSLVVLFKSSSSNVRRKVSFTPRGDKFSSENLDSSWLVIKQAGSEKIAGHILLSSLWIYISKVRDEDLGTYSCSVGMQKTDNTDVVVKKTLAISTKKEKEPEIPPNSIYQWAVVFKQEGSIRIQCQQEVHHTMRRYTYYAKDPKDVPVWTMLYYWNKIKIKRFTQDKRFQFYPQVINSKGYIVTEISQADVDKDTGMYQCQSIGTKNLDVPYFRLGLNYTKDLKCTKVSFDIDNRKQNFELEIQSHQVLRANWSVNILNKDNLCDTDFEQRDNYRSLQGDTKVSSLKVITGPLKATSRIDSCRVTETKVVLDTLWEDNAERYANEPRCGSNAEIAVKCSDNIYCQNGGTCWSMPAADGEIKHCVCPAFYGGSKCQLYIGKVEHIQEGDAEVVKDTVVTIIGYGFAVLGIGIFIAALVMVIAVLVHNYRYNGHVWRKRSASDLDVTGFQNSDSRRATDLMADVSRLAEATSK